MSKWLAGGLSLQAYGYCSEAQRVLFSVLKSSPSTNLALAPLLNKDPVTAVKDVDADSMMEIDGDKVPTPAAVFVEPQPPHEVWTAASSFACDVIEERWLSSAIQLSQWKVVSEYASTTSRHSPYYPLSLQ